MRYRQEVRRGAALLDEKEPGWRDRISLPELEMSDCSRCVVGQVLGIGEYEAGIYYDTMKKWFLAVNQEEDWDEQIQHGFFTLGSWGDLRDAWIGFIKGEWS